MSVTACRVALERYVLFLSYGVRCYDPLWVFLPSLTYDPPPPSPPRLYPPVAITRWLARASWDPMKREAYGRT